MTKIDKSMIAFLTILFAFAAIDKLIHLHGFINAIDSYRILPFPMGRILAPLIIAIESAIAFGLLKDGWRRIAALLAACLLVLLTGALTANSLFGSKGVCGCWFSINMAQGNMHFVLNAAMIAMSLFVWHASKRSEPVSVYQL
jgi:hypothetical protein